MMGEMAKESLTNIVTALLFGVQLLEYDHSPLARWDKVSFGCKRRK
jgi:hypothetical protein